MRSFVNIRVALEEAVNTSRIAEAECDVLVPKNPSVFKPRQEMIHARAECLYAVIASTEEFKQYKENTISVGGGGPELSELLNRCGPW